MSCPGDWGEPTFNTHIHPFIYTHIHMCKVSTLRTSHDFMFHSRTFWWTLSLNRSDEVQRNKGGGIGGLEKARALDREREREVGVHTPLSKNNILTERLAIWIFWTQDYGWCLNLFFPLLPLWLPQTQPLACMEILYDDNHPAAAWTALQSTKGKQWVIWVCFKIENFGTWKNSQELFYFTGLHLYK